MNEQEIIDSLKKFGVPEQYCGGLTRYIIDGILPGSFLQAVLESNLIKVVFQADDGVTMESLVNLAKWVFNEAPMQCWGSREQVTAWIAQKAKERDENKEQQ